MHDIFIPVVGMAPDDVVLVSWLKSAGEAISVGDVVALVETSKAEMEVESAAAGTLGQHLVAEMDSVAPGTVIARVLSGAEYDASATIPAPTVQPAGLAAQGATDPGPTAAEGSELRAAKPPPETASVSGAKDRAQYLTSPRARSLAAEVLARETSGGAPGHDGTAAQTVPAPTVQTQRSEPVVPGQSDDRFRSAVAAAVTKSWQEIPHFAVTRELRVDALVAAVADIRIVLPQVTFTDVLLRALALSFMVGEGRTDLDIGLAVATDRGVAIPVIRDVPRLDLLALAGARRDAAERARAGRIDADDGRVPVTTLSNLGSMGVDQFTGIVPLGQTSLLTVGRAASRPVVDEGRLAIGVTMYATLNLDHRSWDGRHGAELLDRFARILGAPALLVGFGSLPASALKEI